jgi:L-arabinose isomerase
MSWKNEFDEKFVRRFTLSEDRENTNIPNCAYSNLLGVSIDASDIKDFIEELIKETREDEHKKTWDNIKEIYDTTDYKKHIEEAIKETEQRVAKEILSGIEVRHRLIKGHFLSVDEYDYIKQKYIKESK